MHYSRGVKQKAWGPESVRQFNPPDSFGRWEEGMNFRLLTIIFIGFTAFPTDKDLIHDHSYCIKVNK